MPCTCRLIHREKVILTRSSYYFMRDPDDDYNDEDTLFHHLAVTVVPSLLPLTVTQVTVTPLSDLCIHLGEETRLEVFAENMPCFEQWRFFLGNRDDLPHMVAYGDGIVFEG